MRDKALLYALLVPFLLVAAEEPISTSVESVSPTRWSFRASDHFIFSNAPENASDKSQPSTKTFMNELKLSGEYGSYNGYVKISNRYTPDGNRSKNAPVKLEKKLLAYEGETLNVKLGDSYQEMGKGIALSLYNDSAFGIDNTLEGAAVRADIAPVKFGTFAGRVNTLRSPVAINIEPDPLADKDVWLGGAEVAVNYTDSGRIGLHGLGTMNQNYGTKRIDKRQYTVGGFLSQEAVFGGPDLYLEGNYLNTEQIEPQRANLPEGYGSYAALSYADLPWKFKLEGKDYRNFVYEWQRPPTLEEDVIRQNNFKDVTAVRAGVERKILENGSGVASFSYLAGQDREVNSVINHPVVGTKFPIEKAMDVELKTGYRWVANRNNLVHASAKTKIKTGKGEALELEYKKQFWTLDLDLSQVKTEERNLFGVGYIFSEKVSALLGYEYIPTNEIDAGKHFVNVGGTYREGWLSTRAFVGQTSGGTQCNGGVCRVVPPYTGAYLEGTVSF